MEIYVALVKFGNFEDQHTSILYAGCDKEIANEKIAENRNLIKTYSNAFGYIQTWVNGEKINELEFDF